ncbi:hypothetical protein U1Q18_050493, partial [Sarracenia purpurea var. burkii]
FSGIGNVENTTLCGRSGFWAIVRAAIGSILEIYSSELVSEQLKRVRGGAKKGTEFYPFDKDGAEEMLGFSRELRPSLDLNLISYAR